MTDRRLSGFARLVAVVATFALGCAASVGLWIAWTGRCNESCPDKTVVGMMIFLALLPTFGTLGAVLLVATAWPLRVKTLVGAVMFLVAAAGALWLTLVAGARGG